MHDIKVNRHGHMVVTIGGSCDKDLVGEGCVVLEGAKRCLERIDNSGDYPGPRLVHGVEYKVALVPGDIVPPSKRIARLVLDLGRSFGYEAPSVDTIKYLAPVLPREAVGEQGAWYVEVPHKPVQLSRRRESWYNFGLRWDDTGVPIVFAGWYLPDRSWFDGVLFAFYVPAESSAL